MYTLNFDEIVDRNEKADVPAGLVSETTLMQGPLHVNCHPQDIIADARLQNVETDILVTD